MRTYAEHIASVPTERFIEVGGRRVYVEQHGAGEPLLLLHGFASSSYAFRDIIPLLAENHRVIAPDLNGFGYTERPPEPERYSPRSQNAVIGALLDRLGIGSCSVLGQSYGGTLALILAADAPERVRKLVLVSPATQFDKGRWMLRLPPMRFLLYAMVRALLRRPGAYRNVLSKAYHREEVLTDEVVDFCRGHLLVEGLRDAARGFGFSFRTPGALDIDFDRVAARTLILAGEHDAIIPLEDCRRARCRLRQAELKVLPDCGHSSPEEQPELVVGHIHRFLGKGACGG